jgi:peroxiredoxin
MIGQAAKNFTLPDLEGIQHSLAGYQGRVVILNFWSAECPWSERADRKLAELRSVWGEPVVVLSIASNAGESVEMRRAVSAERELPTLLLDARQNVADLYQAVTTPHIFIIDRRGVLRYQGAFDDTTFRQRQPTRCYVQEVVDALLAGLEPDVTQVSPYGCTIVRNLR